MYDASVAKKKNCCKRAGIFKMLSMLQFTALLYESIKYFSTHYVVQLITFFIMINNTFCLLSSSSPEKKSDSMREKKLVTQAKWFKLFMCMHVSTLLCQEHTLNKCVAGFIL